VFRNILVSVDRSPQADRALAEAIDIARASRARLTLLTAIPKPPGWICTPMTACASRQLELDFEREAKQTLCAAIDLVPADMPATKILTKKPIREALLDEARSGRCDLIVVAAAAHHSRTALRATVSQYLLRRCDVPVLIVEDESWLRGDRRRREQRVKRSDHVFEGRELHLADRHLALRGADIAGADEHQRDRVRIHV
jgi:nucleotide-binding universal stress UspA family protein